MAEYIMHEQPVWYKSPHFTLQYPIHGRPDTYEQLICEEVGEQQFRLLCIPFFIYDLALGDTIEGDPFVEHSQLKWRTVERSGRKVFRVWFKEAPQEVIKGCLKDLKQLGALTERSSRNLYGIDAANDDIAQEVADYLLKGEQEGKWEYETGGMK